MADWKRMERHIRYGRIAEWVRIIAVIAVCDEACSAVREHFPLWDDIAMPVTFVVDRIAKFVIKHTEMYRIDL